MSTSHLHSPVQLGTGEAMSAATLLVPRQRVHPARYLDAAAPRPQRARRLPKLLRRPARRTGRHRAEPMRAPTWRDAWTAVMSSVVLSGQPLDLRSWLAEQQLPPDQRHPLRPGRHARPTPGGGPRISSATWRRMT